MFDKLKAMGALTALMKNQDKIKESIAKVREQMERTTVTGSAGGGAATVTCSGQMKILGVELSPALVNGMAADEKTRLLAGSLIAEATNEALKQAQARLRAAMEKEMQALGLADLGLGDNLGPLGGLLT
jgi:DNA-binding YbaB/EbfC family protein